MDGEPSAISIPAPDTPTVPDWWGAAAETQSKEGQNIPDSSRLRQATNAYHYSETTSNTDRHEEHGEQLANAIAMVGALEGRDNDAMLRVADLEEDIMAVRTRMLEAVQQLGEVRLENVHLQEEKVEAAAIRQQCKEQQLLIQTLKDDFERQRHTVQLLEGENRTFEEAVSTKQEAQAKSDALQGEMKELKMAIQSQEVELQGLEQDNVQLQEKLHVEDMQQEKQDLQEAHTAELELQSGHYADLAAKLRKVQASADAQAYLGMLEERFGTLEAQKSDVEARLANIQVEAGEALDIAERATTLLQQETTQLQLQNDDLKAALASQGPALADSMRRVEALQQDLEEATKNAAQAATEQAARALALYAAATMSLREQLAEAQASAAHDAPVTVAGLLRSAGRSLMRQRSSLSSTPTQARPAGMGTFSQRNGSLVSGGLSYTKTVGLQEEVDAKRAQLAQLKAQLMMEQVVATNSGWQRQGRNNAELLIRHYSDEPSSNVKGIHQEQQAWEGEADHQASVVEELRRELDEVKARNEELQTAIKNADRLKQITSSQPLEQKLASYEGDGWLEQCCASLAEQLRVAQAENVELQKTVEELRGDSSGQSSPMAWDGTRAGSGNFESALEMETSSQGSRQSRARTNSWTSQRSLEAQVAALRQQLDISAATEVELQREIELLRKEGGAEAVESAVAVAVAARDSELAAMQRHIMELEDALDAALQEAADAQHESLELRNALAHLEAALRDSEAKREAMQQEKHMLEAHLLQTAGEVAVAERELTGSQLSSLASARSSSMSYSSDSDDSDATASIGGGSPPRSKISRLAEMSAREVESLRAENDAIMKELVEKKIELAELHEELIKLNHARAHAHYDTTKRQ
ncbi:g7144 [Coccomyxa elongata]